MEESTSKYISATTRTLLNNFEHSVQNPIKEWVFRPGPHSAKHPLRYQLLRVCCIGLGISQVVGYYSLESVPVNLYFRLLPYWLFFIPFIQDLTGSTNFASVILLTTCVIQDIANTYTLGGFEIMAATNGSLFVIIATLLLGVRVGLLIVIINVIHAVYLYQQYIENLSGNEEAYQTARVVLMGWSSSLIVNFALAIIQEHIRWRYMEDLAAAKENAVMGAQQKTRFVSFISHELRNPLSAMQSIVDLVLHNDPNLSEETRNSMSMVHDVTEDLLRILTDILDATKVSAAKMSTSKYNFDLHELTIDRCHVMSGISSEKGLEMLIDYPANCPRSFRGDAGKVKQVLGNLITNAVKFTDKGYVKVSIMFESDSPVASTIVCIVKDTGRGITSEQQTRLFQEFSQVDKGDQPTPMGSGLGLFLVKRLVELMGGEVFVSSTEGVGSEFGFRILLEKQDVAVDDRSVIVGEIPENNRNITLSECPGLLSSPPISRVSSPLLGLQQQQQQQQQSPQQSPQPPPPQSLQSLQQQQLQQPNSSPRYSRPRANTPEENLATIAKLHNRPFYLFSQSEIFANYIHELCVDRWHVGSFNRLEDREEDGEQEDIGLPSPVQKHMMFTIPKRREHDIPAVFIIDLSGDLLRQIDQSNDSDDDSETLASNQIRQRIEDDDEMLQELLEAFTTGLLARCPPPNTRSNPRPKDTVIFFHSFHQAHKVRPTHFLNILYDVSVCRKPVTEREVLSMIRVSRKIGNGGVSSSGKGGSLRGVPLRPKSPMSSRPTSFCEIEGISPVRPGSSPLSIADDLDRRLSLLDDAALMNLTAESDAISPDESVTPRRPAPMSRSNSMVSLTASESSAGSQPQRPTPRVLVVEDNVINRTLVKRQLKCLGVPTIDCAVDGMDALEKFAAKEEGHYNIVLMDLHMPKCDGETATRLFREKERERSLSSPSTVTDSTDDQLRPSIDSRSSSDSGVVLNGIPIIALTADQGMVTEERKKLENVGIDDILVKPVSLNALSALLERYVKGYVSKGIEFL